MDSKKYFQKVLYYFLLLFGFSLVSGVVLIFISFETVPFAPTTVNITIKPEQLSFNLSTGVPGVILTFFGFVGLLTLLIKIPVKEVVQVIAGGGGKGQTIGFLTTRTEYIDHELPVFLYWILRERMGLIRQK